MSKVKLFFTLSEKKFYYEGLPENRHKDLIEFIAKMKDRVPEDQVATVFRANIDETALSDDEIRAEVKEVIDRKAAKKAAKKANAETAPGAGAATAPPPDNTTDNNGPPEPQVSAPAQVPANEASARQSNAHHVDPSASPPQANDAAALNSAGTPTQPGAPEPCTAEERTRLNKFIAEVMEEQPQTVEESIRRPPPLKDMSHLATPPNAGAATAAPSANASAVADMSSSGANFVMSPSTQGYSNASGGGSNGRVMVYLSQPHTNTNKVMSITPSETTFESFSQQCEKKFGGGQLRYEFHEGDDIIELDDDDSLAMFLSLAVAKLRLQCIPMVARKDDAFTGIADHMSEAQKLEAALKLAREGANGASSSLDSGAATKDGEKGDGAKDGEGSTDSAAAAKPPATSREFHKEIKTFTGHTAAVYSCAFAPGGERFATASRDKTVRVWNVKDGESKPMKDGHDGLVLSCDFSPNGEFIVSSSDDRTMKLWNANTGSKISTMKGHKDKVYCCQFNTTGAYLLSASCDHTVRVWNADTQSKAQTLKGHELAVFSAGFSNTDAGKHIVSASDDRTVRIWDWRNNKEIRTLQGHTGTVWSCQFSNNDKLIASASMDHEIKIWDVASGNVLHTLNGHMTPIHHAIFTPDDKYLLSCARDWTVMVWNVETGENVTKLTGHCNTVYHMDVFQNHLLTCSLDDTVRLWNLALPV